MIRKTIEEWVRSNVPKPEHHTPIINGLLRLRNDQQRLEALDYVAELVLAKKSVCTIEKLMRALGRLSLTSPEGGFAALREQDVARCLNATEFPQPLPYHDEPIPKFGEGKWIDCTTNTRKETKSSLRPFFQHLYIRAGKDPDTAATRARRLINQDDLDELPEPESNPRVPPDPIDITKLDSYLAVAELSWEHEAVMMHAFFSALEETGDRATGFFQANIGNVQHNEHTQKLEITRTRGRAKKRTQYWVPSEKAAARMQEWLDVHPDGANPEAPLFINPYQANHDSVVRLTPKAATNLFRRYSEQAGCSRALGMRSFRYHLHDVLAEQGHSQANIANRFGRRGYGEGHRYPKLSQARVVSIFTRIKGLDATGPKPCPACGTNYEMGIDICQKRGCPRAVPDARYDVAIHAKQLVAILESIGATPETGGGEQDSNESSP